MKPAPAMSKSLAAANLRKNIEDLHKRLITAIAQLGNPTRKEDVETVLASAKSKEVLLHVLNDDISFQYPLEMLCSLAARASQRPTQQHHLPELKKNISLLLSHGADPNLQKLGEMPILILFIDVSLKTFLPGYKFPFKEQVIQLIENGAALDLVGINEFTLIHMAAALDRELLSIFCDRLPASALTQVDEYGETALFTAIRFKNTANALELILKRNINIHLPSKDRSLPLGACIFFLNPMIAQCLLSQGSSIDIYSSVVLRDPLNGPAASEQKKLLLILMKAGFYITLTHRGAQFKALKHHFKDQWTKIPPFIIALEDVDTKNIEYITSFEGMLNAQSKISLAQTKRLHQSFQEVIAAYEKDNDPNLNNIIMLHETFTELYPYAEAIILPPTENKSLKIQRSQSETFNLRFISTILKEAMNSPHSQNLLNAYLQRSKEVFRQGWATNYSLEEMLTFMQEYGEHFIQAHTLIWKEKLENTYFEYFVSKLTYRFVLTLYPNIILNVKSQKDFVLIHPQLVSLFSLAIAFNLKYEEKSSDDAMSMLDQLIILCAALAVPQETAIYYILLRESYRLDNYVTLGFFDELNEPIDLILGYESIFDVEQKRKQSKSTFPYHSSVEGLIPCLQKALYKVLEKLDLTSISFSTHLTLIHKIDYLANRYQLKNVSEQVLLHKGSLLAQYNTFLESLGIAKPPFEGNGLFTFKLVKDELRITLHSSANKSRIRHTLVSPSIISCDAQGYYIPIYGMSFEAIQERLSYLATLKLEDYQRADPSKHKVITPQTTPPNWSVTPNQGIIVPKNNPTFSAASSSSSAAPKPTQDHFAENKKEIEEKIKTEIAKEKQVPTENVFLIHAPWMPKNKASLVWGYWDEISGEKVDDKTLEKHKSIALKGKVTTRDKGEAGLKSKKVIDPHTKTKATIVKTKDLGQGKTGDIRIESDLPEPFHDLTLYRFGKATVHS